MWSSTVLEMDVMCVSSKSTTTFWNFEDTNINNFPIRPLLCGLLLYLLVVLRLSVLYRVHGAVHGSVLSVQVHVLQAPGLQ